MTRGSLPKGFSGGTSDPGDDDKEDKFSIRLCIGLMILASILIAIGSLFGIITNTGAITEEGMKHVPTFRIIFVASLIIGTPMMILAYSKYRKLELTTPTWFTKLYYGGRDAKQCTICQKHPTSKKYHIKNVHKMENVNVNDYFRDCGCNKCAKYNKSGD